MGHWTAVPDRPIDVVCDVVRSPTQALRHLPPLCTFQSSRGRRISSFQMASADATLRDSGSRPHPLTGRGVPQIGAVGLCP